jgi:energy-converting hydrogenase Eha subunit C
MKEAIAIFLLSTGIICVVGCGCVCGCLNVAGFGNRGVMPGEELESPPPPPFHRQRKEAVAIVVGGFVLAIASGGYLLLADRSRVNPPATNPDGPTASD